MLKWLLSLLAATNQDSPPPLPLSTPLAPLGEYAWAVYDPNTPSLDGGNQMRYEDGLKRSLYVCHVRQAALIPQVGVILSAFPSPSYFLPAMLYRNELSLLPMAQAIFRKLGEEESRGRFRCWPELSAIPNHDLSCLSSQDLFLLSYIASLKQKQHFQLQKMPLSVTRVLSGSALSESFERLAASGILIPENGRYTLVTTGSANGARVYFAELEAIAKFIVEAEAATSILAWEIQMAQQLGHRLAREKLIPGDKVICPACATTLKRKQFVPLEESSLQPFHYYCMSRWVAK